MECDPTKLWLKSVVICLIMSKCSVLALFCQEFLFYSSLLMYSPEPRFSSYLAYSLDSTHSARFYWGAVLSRSAELLNEGHFSPTSAPTLPLPPCLAAPSDSVCANWLSGCQNSQALAECLYDSGKNRLKLLSHFTLLWLISVDSSLLTAEGEAR